MEPDDGGFDHGRPAHHPGIRVVATFHHQWDRHGSHKRMNFDANVPPIKVIQVGLGGFGRSWAQLAHSTNGISMTGAVDPFPAARDWAARELDAQLPLFSSLSEALPAVETDAVLVITPPPTHHEIVSE